MADEAQSRLTEALSDRYTIERELGSGGMATVYLAHDLKHDRKVAIKVMRPELSAILGGERFLREVSIAAKLNHPHILALYDSGEAEEFLYYVMPYVEGESLGAKLNREKQLSVDEAISITKQVGAALDYAHEQGVIHRDIKPENILLSQGEALVADFGIALAVSAAGGTRLTDTGLSLGTPEYMSPEQAAADRDLDGRSDVYALGCVLYEMLAGEPPYTGATVQSVLAKKLSEPLPRISVVRESVPPAVETALAKALAKTPADRHVTAQQFAEALTAEQVVARVGKRRWPHRAAAAAAVVVVLIAAWGLFTLRGGPTYDRLAVLPPANLMNDPEQEYFVAGMHNALISELQKAGVAVIGRTSVLQYENTQKPIAEIATELGVDAIVEASVFRAEDSVEIEVRVVDGTTQQAVADPIVRRSALRDVERLYRGLTAAIAADIRVALSPRAEAHLANARPINPQAYEDYLRGRFHYQRLTRSDLDAAFEYFESALRRDSTYAPAHAGIASVWIGRAQMGSVRRRDAAPLAVAAAERAVKLDSTLVEVQTQQAVLLAWDQWDWAGAEVAFERVIAINPNDPSARSGYSHLLLWMKRPNEALEQSQLAVELDPLNHGIQAFHGIVLLYADRYDDAIAQFNSLLRTEPNNPLGLGGLHAAYHAKGLYEEAMAAARSTYLGQRYGETQEALAVGYAEAGYQGAMRRTADALAELSRVTYVPPSDIALQYAVAGEDGLALEWLERGFEERDPGVPYLSVHPCLDALHDDQRFQELLRRMGLPQ